jgi:mannose-1-phosphate guanylyltransferase/mannose-6-phosphate isomerase
MKIIILAGGKGTRLWPMSRKTSPKQFLKLNSKTLFKKTLKRCLLLEKPENIFVSTNKDYSFLVQKEFKNANLIIEPFSKNTGPAILYALKKLNLKNNELVLVCPSDHFITPDSEFVKSINKAKEIAKSNHIVTFGIKPTSPETGYGYIKIKPNQFKVQKFTEKPNLKTAQDFLNKGNYYWNSGIFLFPVDLIMQEFEKYAKDLLEKTEPISIDKAVIEKSDKIAMLPATFNWSDVGSWNSFYKTQAKDKNNNTTLGNTILHNTKDSLILGNSRLIACIGLKNITVIETEDAVLVANKDDSEKVKQIVENLEKQNKREAYEGVKTLRPWGSYEIIGEGKDYKVKKIIVEPKKRLSLQSHNHRSENWVVIQGKAKITLNNNEYILKKGEAFFIPKKARHRLENIGDILLKVIEVQNGDYLGEDDITRYEDDFNRK